MGDRLGSGRLRAAVHGVRGDDRPHAGDCGDRHAGRADGDAAFLQSGALAGTPACVAAVLHLLPERFRRPYRQQGVAGGTGDRRPARQLHRSGVVRHHLFDHHAGAGRHAGLAARRAGGAVDGRLRRAGADLSALDPQICRGDRGGRLHGQWPHRRQLFEHPGAKTVFAGRRRRLHPRRFRAISGRHAPLHAPAVDAAGPADCALGFHDHGHCRFCGASVGNGRDHRRRRGVYAEPDAEAQHAARPADDAAQRHPAEPRRLGEFQGADRPAARAGRQAGREGSSR